MIFCSSHHPRHESSVLSQKLTNCAVIIDILCSSAATTWDGPSKQPRWRPPPKCCCCCLLQQNLDRSGILQYSTCSWYRSPRSHYCQWFNVLFYGRLLSLFEAIIRSIYRMMIDSFASSIHLNRCGLNRCGIIADLSDLWWDDWSHFRNCVSTFGRLLLPSCKINDLYPVLDQYENFAYRVFI